MSDTKMRFATVYRKKISTFRKDYISACLYLLDVVKNKIPSEEHFKHQAKPLLLDFVRQILGQCMDSSDNNNSTQKVTHYKVN